MFEELIGARESEIIGKTDYAFVVKELADVIRDDDNRAMAASKSSSRMEWITFASDGSRIFLNTIKTPMYDAEGTLIGVLGIGRDITENHKLEEQLRHAQKMEGIGTLAGGIAHDFNNILSAIIGYGHITLMKLPENDPLRLNIERILESADRAAALTQGLLTFSRKRVVERKPVELNSILKRVEQFLVRIIGEDIKVRVAFAEGPVNIFGNSDNLEQVLMNLATNARDAMPNGGLFTIEAGITELDNSFVSAHGYGKPGMYAIIVATDTGVGMNEETRGKIFEPFFSTKEVGKGTGLGLAMVYGIIKQHEGFINVYSEPGKGTAFRIYLPLIKTEAVEEQLVTAAEYPKGGTETILVAEDDVSVRNLTLLVLEQMGYTVITANDGEEAVKKFMQNKDRIQLLLFDIIMPNKNGREAYEEIKKTKPDILVLFASGYSPDMLRVKELIDEDAVLVYKPLSPQNLLKKVREVLDRK
jgi:PAS domain S-box-containing protein